MAAKTKSRRISKTHVHMLQRVKGHPELYHCVDAECFFSYRAEFLLGKLVLCNYCPKTFRLDAHNLRLAKPHCPTCKPYTNLKQSKVEHRPPVVVQEDDLLTVLERMPEL